MLSDLRKNRLCDLSDVYDFADGLPMPAATSKRPGANAGGAADVEFASPEIDNEIHEVFATLLCCYVGNTTEDAFRVWRGVFAPKSTRKFTYCCVDIFLGTGDAHHLAT